LPLLVVVRERVLVLVLVLVRMTAHVPIVLMPMLAPGSLAMSKTIVAMSALGRVASAT
jgi:hypothetical protein